MGIGLLSGRQICILHLEKRRDDIVMAGSNRFGLVIFLLTVACTPDYDQKLNDGLRPAYSSIGINRGIRVSVDPYIDEKKTINTFNVDLMAKGLLAVHVLIKNGRGSPIRIKRKNIRLVAPDGTQFISVTPREAATVVSGDTSVIGPSLPGIFILGTIAKAVGIATKESRFRNLREKFERNGLRDLTISPGTGANGFVFFHTSSDPAFFQKSTLRLSADDLEELSRVIVEVRF